MCTALWAGNYQGTLFQLDRKKIQPSSFICCPSTCPSQCNALPLIVRLPGRPPTPASLRGDHHLPSGLLTHLPSATVGHVDACLTHKHSPCSNCPRTCLAPLKVSSRASQKETLLGQNQAKLGKKKMLSPQKMQGEKLQVLVEPNQPPIESQVVFSGATLANANVPMVPLCFCYGELPPASHPAPPPHTSEETAPVHPRSPHCCSSHCSFWIISPFCCRF